MTRKYTVVEPFFDKYVSSLLLIQETEIVPKTKESLLKLRQRMYFNLNEVLGWTDDATSSKWLMMSLLDDNQEAYY